MIAGAWVLQLMPPVWRRYEYYRIQSQAADYPQKPRQVLLQYSATQPYRHVAGKDDQFFGSFLAAAGQCQLPRITIAGSSSTPIFCGLRTTRGGHSQIVQIYSSVSTIGAETDLSIQVVSFDWHGWKWVLTSKPDSFGSVGWGVALGGITIRLDSKAEISVSGGSSNQADPSAFDVDIVLNGRPSTLRFHITEVTQSPLHVGIALDQTSFGRLFDDTRGWSASGIWQWPFTGK
jgi:hypothetical protein